VGLVATHVHQDRFAVVEPAHFHVLRDSRIVTGLVWIQGQTRITAGIVQLHALLNKIASEVPVFLHALLEKPSVMAHVSTSRPTPSTAVPAITGATLTKSAITEPVPVRAAPKVKLNATEHVWTFKATHGIAARVITGATGVKTALKEPANQPANALQEKLIAVDTAPI